MLCIKVWRGQCWNGGSAPCGSWLSIKCAHDELSGGSAAGLHTYYLHIPTYLNTTNIHTSAHRKTFPQQFSCQSAEGKYGRCAAACTPAPHALIFSCITSHGKKMWMFSWFFHYLLNKKLIRIVQKSFKAHLSRIMILFSHQKDLIHQLWKVSSLKFL